MTDGCRWIGRKDAQKAQESDGTAQDGSRRADSGGLAAKKRKRRKKIRPYGRLKFFHATLGVEMW